MLSYAQETAASPEAGWQAIGNSHMGWMAKELNLTDAQKAQIKSMMQSQPRHHASADAAARGKPSRPCWRRPPMALSTRPR